MKPFQTIVLNYQFIYLFDLNLPNTARSQRQAVLDKVLTQFFQKQLTENPTQFWQNFQQFSQIIHRQGQPAQAIFLAKKNLASNGEKISVNLAISYALPFVAVALSMDKIGLDLCAVADFDGMNQPEKIHFCQDYFPHLPVTTDNSTLAKNWSSLEASLKYQQITLAQAVESPSWLQGITVISEQISFNEKNFWLSLAK